MKRSVKVLLTLCCLFAVAVTFVSCGVGELPDEDTLRKDFESYLNYYGELPFTYNFKSFEVQNEVKDNKEKTAVITVETSVDRKYGEETYSDITYVAEMHYALIDGGWSHEFVVVTSSNVITGFDMETIFVGTTWNYSEENSRTEADKLEEEGVPLSLTFEELWDGDTLSAILGFGEDDSDLDATLRGLESYVKRYSETYEWDFRVSYQLENGAVIDFVHISDSMFEAGNWVIGYRQNATKERAMAFFTLVAEDE
jgi:hypothetical protein